MLKGGNEAMEENDDQRANGFQQGVPTEVQQNTRGMGEDVAYVAANAEIATAAIGEDRLDYQCNVAT